MLPFQLFFGKISNIQRSSMYKMFYSTVTSHVRQPIEDIKLDVMLPSAIVSSSQ